MTLTYTLTELVMRHGASMHYDYRAPILRWVRPLLGVLLIPLGVSQLFGSDQTLQVLGALMIPLGLFALFRKILFVRSCARNVVKGQAGDGTIPCTLSATEEGIEINATTTKSASTWDSFVDLKITPAGVLLYPQKSIFLWIPKEAGVEGGDWDGFCALLASKVRKTI